MTTEPEPKLSNGQDPSGEVKPEESPTPARPTLVKGTSTLRQCQQPVPEPAEDGVHDLSNPEYYLNRELTWLNFNYRVLHEASDERVPLLERVKFLSIVSSNLDEFVMKRIGGLKQQVGAGVQELTVDGRSPRRQIEECTDVLIDQVRRLGDVYRELEARLAEHEIVLTSYDSLGEADQEELRQFYLENIFPLVTPQATDPAHPFPFISNLSLNLLVTLRYPGESTQHLARVKVPVGANVPRFLKLEGSRTFVPLESVMRHNLGYLFPGMEIDGCELFRVVRNANTEQDEESAEDLLAMIESELRERRFAPVVRLEVEAGMSAVHKGMLASELGLTEATDVAEIPGLLGLRDLMEIASLPNRELHDPAHHPVDHPALTPGRSIFHVIRDEKEILLHHPYESFSTSVERFLKEASRDPKVRAIKMTIYRTSAGSKAIGYLIDAARNGKQVAVVVELKARFDESANIRWAARLESAGIHVTYGVVGLKTHCKVILVVRQDFNGLRRYVHIGTGNYHAGTARIYSDVGILAYKSKLGKDCTELFNYLTTGYKPKRTYGKLLVAPKQLKEKLLQKIDREVELHSAETPGRIQLKMNALEDADITRALYRASRAGVKVDLIVRDSCRLRPGIPQLSESARVVSIVGRFLEHARIYYFQNGGDEEYYIGSADAMKRNLNSRVEVLTPVVGETARGQLREILDIQLGDSRSAWEMQPDGSYVQLQPGKGKDSSSSQERLIRTAEDRFREANRLRRRKPRSLGRRNVR